MIWLLIPLIIAAAFILFVIWIAGAPEAAVKRYKPLDELIEKHYREDIDFSLAAKGYPVVNDMDIAYSEHLARHPERINL